jgi:hypothetical protein
VRIDRGSLVAVVAAAVLLAGLLAPTASAVLALGGGAGIIVGGSYCTLATIGHDKAGELVGFTAAHCGGPGAQVVSEGTDTTVGTVVAANGGIDYAVIKFDPAKVTPIPNFAGFLIKGIDTRPHEWGQPACKFGAATGDFCSDIFSIPSPGPRMSMHGLFQPGDDGGPVTSDDLLIGMIRNGEVLTPLSLGFTPKQITFSIKIATILDDVNANGGPGAEFTPI